MGFMKKITSALYEFGNNTSVLGLLWTVLTKRPVGTEFCRYQQCCQSPYQDQGRSLVAHLPGPRRAHPQWLHRDTEGLLQELVISVYI